MVTGTVSPVEVLKKYRTIAVVGASKNPEKEAYSVPRYLKDHGYRIIPVNPTATEIMGETAYRSLLDMPEDVGRTVDVVEVFRPSEELPQVALQAAEMKRALRAPVRLLGAAGPGERGGEGDPGEQRDSIRDGRLHEDRPPDLRQEDCLRSSYSLNFVFLAGREDVAAEAAHDSALLPLQGGLAALRALHLLRVVLVGLDNRFARRCLGADPAALYRLAKIGQNREQGRYRAPRAGDAVRPRIQGVSHRHLHRMRREGALRDD